MELPISPILVDVAMEHILDQAISKLNYNLGECIKYVVDLFLIILKSMVNYTLNVFQSINPKICFTHEVEKNDTLPYLDVMVMHDPSGSIVFNGYSKPTSSDKLSF